MNHPLYPRDRDRRFQYHPTGAQAENWRRVANRSVLTQSTAPTQLRPRAHFSLACAVYELRHQPAAGRPDVDPPSLYGWCAPGAQLCRRAQPSGVCLREPCEPQFYLLVPPVGGERNINKKK